MEKISKSLALLTLSLAVAVVAAEGLLQLFPGLLPRDVYQHFYSRGIAEPEIGNLPKPGSSGVIVTHDFSVPYQVDTRGFRNDEPWPKQPDIVVVGDSLVFGYGVDRNNAWPQLLSSLSGKSVVNLGLIGASPQQYQRVYKTFGRPLSPHVAVIGFFARNDYWDTASFAEWEESGVGGNYLEWRDFGRPTAAELEKPINRVMLEAKKRSYLAALVKFGWRTLKGNPNRSPTTLNMPDGTILTMFEKDFRAKTEYARSSNEIFSTVINTLDEMHDAAFEDGTRFLVLLQPSKEEVYRVNENEPYLDASAALRESLDRLGIEYLDAAPEFRKKGESGETLFFPTDGHPNARGYALLAELVANYIETMADPDTGSLSPVE